MANLHGLVTASVITIGDYSAFDLGSPGTTVMCMIAGYVKQSRPVLNIHVQIFRKLIELET